MNEYYDGQLVRVTATFTDTVTGDLINPTTVTLSTMVNRGTPTVVVGVGAVIHNPSVGVFYADLDTTGSPGTWCAQFAGTGAAQAVDADWFTVLPSPV